jgi:hypothetical protein
MEGKKSLCFAVALIALGLATLCDARPAERRAARQSANVAEQPQQRITQLVDDSAWPTLTLMYHDDWAARPEERAAIDKWRSMPEWQELAGKFHWIALPASSQMYQERMHADYPQLPAIVAQKADGQVFFKDHAEAANAAPGGLLNRRKNDCDKNCDCNRTVLPWNHQPPPDRRTDVNVIVDGEPPAPPPVPDRVGSDEGKFTGGVIAIAVLGVLLAGLLGAGVFVITAGKSAATKVDSIANS